MGSATERARSQPYWPVGGVELSCLSVYHVKKVNYVQRIETTFMVIGTKCDLSFHFTRGIINNWVDFINLFKLTGKHCRLWICGWMWYV